MGYAAAQHRQLERSPKPEVGGEMGGAAGFGHRRRPGVGDAHAALVGFWPKLVRPEFAAEKPPCQLHRLDDLGVAGAAAKIVAQGLDDFVVARVRLLVKQGLGGHDHPRRAEAALDGTGEDEGLLDEMGVGRGAEPLDGDDLGAIEIGQPGQTGAHRLFIDNDDAGPALALAVAGLFGAGQTQVVTEQVEQHCFRIGDPLVTNAIDTDLHFFHRFSLKNPGYRDWA